MCSIVRRRKIDSDDETTRYRISDGFKVFNRHGDGLYISYLNDETNKMITPLPNLEHDLGIDNNDIYNPTSLSNVLFVEEGQLSTPLHKDVNVLHLNTTKQSSPIIAQPDDDIITSVDENHYTILTNPSSNTKFSQDPNILEEID